VNGSERTEQVYHKVAESVESCDYDERGAHVDAYWRDVGVPVRSDGPALEHGEEEAGDRVGCYESAHYPAEYLVGPAGEEAVVC